MPIPQLDEYGFLPAGVHVCTLDEVKIRFGSFRGSDRRINLFAALGELITEARRTGLFVAIVIDGSFVTGAAAPNDIDLILKPKLGSTPASGVAGRASRPAVWRRTASQTFGTFRCARRFPRGRGKPHARRVRSPSQLPSSGLILLLRRDHDWKRHPAMHAYNVLSRRRLRRRFGFDAFLAVDGEVDYDELVEFFGGVRDNPDVRKGMLRIEL